MVESDIRSPHSGRRLADLQKKYAWGWDHEAALQQRLRWLLSNPDGQFRARVRAMFQRAGAGPDAAGTEPNRLGD